MQRCEVMNWQSARSYKGGNPHECGESRKPDEEVGIIVGETSKVGFDINAASSKFYRPAI